MQDAPPRAAGHRAASRRAKSSSTDAELALALHAQLNADIDADAEFAARLQARPSNGGDEDDAALAARLQADADAEAEDASLALALSLSRQPTEPAEERRRLRGERSDALAAQIFGAGPAAAAPAPAAPVSASLSYATVAGAGDDDSALCGGAAAGYRTASAPAPPQYRSAAAAPQRALPRSLAPPLPPALIVDGANVAYSYNAAADLEGVCHCVHYFLSRPGAAERRLDPSRVVVVLNENRRDGGAALDALAARGVEVCWTPSGRDDDVFAIQCAADHGAWVVTNDAWRDHNARRHANDELRKRRVAYAWMGRTFAPASDDLARFDASRSVR